MAEKPMGPWVWVSVGMGGGQLKNTQGLPMLFLNARGLERWYKRPSATPHTGGLNFIDLVLNTLYWIGKGQCFDILVVTLILTLPSRPH